MQETPAFPPRRCIAVDATVHRGVTIIDPEGMNVLGLMISSLLQRRLADPSGARHARALTGEVTLDASGMRISLHFCPTSVRITRGESEAPRARVRGTLSALLDASLGRKRVWSLLSGRLSVRGAPRTLWHLLLLLKG